MANTFELIASSKLASAQANFEFTAIAQTYTDLMLVCSTRIDTASGVYASLKLQCNGSDITGLRVGAEGNPGFGQYSDTSSSAYTNTTGATASTFNNTSFYITNYASTSAYKAVSIDSVAENNATAAGMDLVAGIYSSNTAITSIKILNASFNLLTDSTAYLYGVKNA